MEDKGINDNDMVGDVVEVVEGLHISLELVADKEGKYGFRWFEGLDIKGRVGKELTEGSKASGIGDFNNVYFCGGGGDGVDASLG